MKRLLVYLVIFSSVCFYSCSSVNKSRVDTKETNKILLESYIASNEFREELSLRGKNWDKKLGIQLSCRSDYLATPTSYWILRPIKFKQGTKIPSEGAWTVRYKLLRCGRSIIYNVIAVAQKGGRLKLGILVPGTTRCSPTLIKDMFLGVHGMVVIKGKNKDCKDINVLDTKVSSGPITITENGKKYEGVWEEKWLVQNCGEHLLLPFCFIPKTTGGTTWIGKQCSDLQ